MNWLKEIRFNADKTQAEVANASGISLQMYWMIENGKRTPSVETAKKIANELNFNWTQFFEEGNENG